MSGLVYRIPDWNGTFESAKSREYEYTRRVYMPNKQHGMGFTRIISEPDGAAIFGIWCMVLQICSQQRLPREGWLTEDGTERGRPLLPQDLALRWRRPESEMERAIDFLSSDKVGWLVKFPAGIHPVSAQYPAAAAAGPLDLALALASASALALDAGAPKPAPPSLSPGEIRSRMRRFLASLRVASDDTAIDEWVGFATDYACADGVDLEAYRDCIETCVRKARKNGAAVRYAQHVEEIGPAYGRWLAKRAERQAAQSAQAVAET